MMRPIARLWFTRTLLPLVGDVFIMIASLALSLAIRQPEVLRVSTFILFAPVFGLWVIAIYTAGLYELRFVRDFVNLVGGLLASAMVCWALGTMYFYLAAPYMKLAPKTHLLLTVVVSHALILAWRRALLAILGFNLLDLKILLLADDDHRGYLRDATHNRYSGGLNVAESLSGDLDLVVVESGWTSANPDQARRHLSRAVANRIPVVGLDEFYESLFGKVFSSHAKDLSWAIDHVLSRSGSLYFKVKRAVDLIAALMLFVAATPIMVMTALLIRCVDGMTPFYGQQRVGHLRRRFILWKFRTMRPGSDEGGPFAPQVGPSDARVTRVGAFLRRFRIDELPQLWNVIRGEMSLVGPRPEWIREVEILEKAVPNYHLRYLAQPGMTGWAQVYFRATNDPQDSIEKHQYDLYYLKHFSLALDFSIMLKTVKRVLVKDSRVASSRSPLPSSDQPVVHSVDIAAIVGHERGDSSATRPLARTR